MLWDQNLLTPWPGLRPLAEIESFSPSLAVDNEARILLIHRAVLKSDRDLEFLKRALAENYLIKLDLDDDPVSFHGLHDDDAFALRCLHAVQVSTPGVAIRLREQVSQVSVFANQIGFLPVPHAPTEGPVRVFLGGYNRHDDWTEIMKFANRVLGYFQDRVAVGVVHNRNIFDALKVLNKQLTPRCSRQAYLKLLATCDIALMPLRDTPFNRCKSDLKFIECAAHGVTSLAPTTLCDATLVDGWTGVLYRSAPEFMVGLQRLIQEVDLRTRIVGTGRKYVAEYRMHADHYEARHAWYLELISKADELWTSYRWRMPELYG
jgi:hypothetical protein